MKEAGKGRNVATTGSSTETCDHWIDTSNAFHVCYRPLRASLELLDKQYSAIETHIQKLTKLIFSGVHKMLASQLVSV